MSTWKIGNYVRSISMRNSKDIYQIIGERGDDWVMYKYRYLGGEHNDGYIPKCVEFMKTQNGENTWEKLSNNTSLGRPKKELFKTFINKS